MSRPTGNHWSGLESAQSFARLLFNQPGVVVELRALGVEGVYGNGVVSGYFDNPEDLVDAAAELDGKAKGVYVTLNPVDPALLARANNRVVQKAKTTTSDSYVTKRRFLLIDADPVRPSGISATEKERLAAFALLSDVAAFLESIGFPAPAKADSGNGGHLLYRVDLPADDGGLVQRVLQALAFLFDSEQVLVDQAVHNSARITKLYGTVAKKGDNTEDRPHRRSRLFEAPDPFEVVPVELLEQVAGMGPAESEVTRPAGSSTPLSIDEFIARHGLEVSRSGPWKDGQRWILGVCPFNADHIDDSAYILQFSNGAIAAGCHHNGCQGKGWSELRDLLEPDRQNRQKAFVSSVSTPPGGSENSPDPIPLPDDLPAVAEFDLQLLPESLRPWVEDITDRVQCSVAFVAVAVMVALAGVLGRKVGIRPKRYDDWLVVANLWGMIIGRPGVMKTPAVKEAFKPVKALEIEAKRDFEEAEKIHEANILVAKQRVKEAEKDIRKALKGGDPQAIALEALKSDEDAPARRRYLVNDSTVEKLGEILKDNPNGVVALRDELIGLLKSLDREGQESARAFYLEAWDGTGRFTYDRIGRGTIDIEAAIVSVFGSIQPGPLTSYLLQAVRSGSGDDGFIQRFQLAVWPDPDPEWKNVDRYPDAQARAKAIGVFRHLDELSPEDAGAEADSFDSDGICYLHFSDDAQEVFDAWRESLEARLRTGEEHPAMESHLAKFRSLVPSLALLIHLADGRRGPVDLDAISMAIGWTEFLESHARRIYSVAMNPDVVVARALVKKIRDGEVKDGFALRDVYRHGWTVLNKKDDVVLAIHLLVDLDWLFETKEQTGGRNKTRYWFNPKILEAPPQGTDKTDRSPVGGREAVSLDPAGTSRTGGSVGDEKPGTGGGRPDKTDRSPSGGDGPAPPTPADGGPGHPPAECGESETAEGGH